MVQNEVTNGPTTPEPNQGALALFDDRAFKNLVDNEAIECTEIAQVLQDAAGGVGT